MRTRNYGFYALPQGEDLDKRAWRLGMRLVVVVVALFFTALQRRRADLHERSGGELASLWGPGFTALILGVGIHYILSIGILMLSDAPLGEGGR